GPAIQPLALRMVTEVPQAGSLPIIGMGGIMTAEDAVEMMLAGAAAVSVGTANFHNPGVTVEIIEGMKNYLREQGIQQIKDIVGIVR
ncbi:MAG: nitronate monooxygenase, partial [Lachnospiraceae bacterium]|nr:nitronate monooxygenase [Lachnospiraceae bacterium]